MRTKKQASKRRKAGWAGPGNEAKDFLQKSYWTTTSHYRGHSAIVQHNTNVATVHSRVTVGGCSVEYEYKLLRQFARVVAHRMPYTSILSICTTSLQGRTNPVRHSLFVKLLGTCFASIQ